METFGAGRIELPEIEVLQNVEHHQRGDALPVGRDLGEVEAAITRGNRRDDFTAMAGEVFGRQKRAARADRRRHLFADGAFVEAFRSLGADGLQRRGQRRKADDVAFLWRLAVEEIMPGGAAIAGELADLALPVPGDARRHRETVPGVENRLLQHAVEAEAAVVLEDVLPRCNRARHRNGMDRVADLAHTPAAQRLGGCGGTGPAAAVVAPDRLARLRDEREAIAADARHVRLDHAQHRDRGHGGIRRGAASAQDVDRRKSRQRMGRCRHAIAGDHRRAAGQLEVTAHDKSGSWETVRTTECAGGCCPRWRDPAAPSAASPRSRRARQRN